MGKEIALASYGPIMGVVLLGGGRLLRQVSLWASSEGMPLKIITSPRHAKEVEDGETLLSFCKRYNIEHLVVKQITEGSVAEFLYNTKGFFYLSLGAAWIFKRSVIKNLFNDQLFNLHGTRLPQDRGGGGFSWQIMMGNRFGFCVLHLVDGGIDTGEIVSAEEFVYPPTARIPLDYQKVYLKKNKNFVIRFIKAHRKEARTVRATRQSEWFSTYWPRLNTEINGYVDWGLSPIEIERFICAFDSPYRGASTFLNGERVFLKNVSTSLQDGVFHPFQSGLIYRKSKNWVCVALSGGTLIVGDIFDEGNRSILDILKVGDRLHTPQSFLESALGRAVYTPLGLKKRVIGRAAPRADP
jgi:methionyl-tRNA formyltransferase